MTIEEAPQLVEVWNAKHPVERCTCGNEGCLERYCSATAIIRMGKQILQQHPESMMMEMVGGDPEAAAKMEQMVEVIKYGVIVVSTLPVIAIYPFLQKYFVQGVMIGAVKG